MNMGVEGNARIQVDVTSWQLVRDYALRMEEQGNESIPMAMRSYHKAGQSFVLSMEAERSASIVGGLHE